MRLLIFLFLTLLPYSCHHESEPISALLSLDDYKAIMSKNHIIIEISKKEDFGKGHIPGAFNLWRNEYTNLEDFPYGGMRANQELLTQCLNKIGFDGSQKIILYDRRGSVEAARFGWILQNYGISYSILDGGLKTWTLKNMPLSNNIRIPVNNQNYKCTTKEDTSYIANLKDVFMAIEDPNTILIDTREPYEFRGEPFIKNNQIFAYKKGAFNRGRIPGAIHLNWSQLVDLKEDHCIKSQKDLEFDLASRGISSDKKIIVYCQTGARSSHTAFVLRNILGYPHVKNYDGSWVEWTYYNQNDSRFVIETDLDSMAFEKKYSELKKDLINLDI